MGELKRDFSGAKMNKDMDERVLPPGQYRDANNIQVATSDGSDVGALQSLLGNTEMTPDVVVDDYCTCVGVLNLPEKDLIYYFVNGGGHNNYMPLHQKDYIIEYNTIARTTRYIFVDIYKTTHTINADQASGMYFTIPGDGSGFQHTGIRIGMMLKGELNDPSGAGVNAVGISSNWGVTVTDIIKNGNDWDIYHSGSSGMIFNGSPFYASTGDEMTFLAPKVLKLPLANQKPITGINYLDGMIYWTDGYNEPRKIHVERSVRGTGGNYTLDGWNDTLLHNAQGTLTDSTFSDSLNNDKFHTRLTRKMPGNFAAQIISRNRQLTLPIWVEEEHITVIKKSPSAPLEIEMSTTQSKRIPTGSDDPNVLFGTINDSFGDADGPLEVGSALTINTTGALVDWRIGDVLLLTDDMNAPPDAFADSDVMVRLKVVGGGGTVGLPDNGGSSGPFSVTVMSVHSDVIDQDKDWFVRLEQAKPLFEYKFPRFSYRWKYTDGEYSCFAPWSEIAFLPGDFDYLPKKGYNLGMTNRCRFIKLKNYFMEHTMVPADVIQVDLLYKETNSKFVYTVKEITEKDGHPEWPDRHLSNWNRGEFTIDSEMIHAMVPSNQLLRPWDNVPRSAKCQEMSGNRLIYGNYKQNYTIDESLRLNIQHAAYTIPESAIDDYEIPIKSCKSMRTYQVGVVWIDEFGRESPVMVPKTGGAVTVPKKDCVKMNRIKAKILEFSNGGSHPPSWAKYLKYYIKETSNEYYNVAMDRFYDAEDGNVWLSFPSAERNKIQDDTFLILKKQHDNSTAVTDLARYKVIAIENRPPLFIKKKRKSYGMNAVGFSGTGLPEEGRGYILVDRDDFDASFSGVYEPDLKPDLMLRIGGVSGSNVLTSEIYKINAISKGATGGGFNKIKIEGFLGAECAPISILNASTDMKMEIMVDEFKDKPEFDGRFFVKILKDLTLEKELLSSFTAKMRYNVVDTMQIGYLNDHSGSGESFYTDWRNSHKTGSGDGNYQSHQSRWIIDDQDAGNGDGDGDAIDTDAINRGGIYNWPQDGSGKGAAGGHGFMDLSYLDWDHGAGLTNGNFRTPWDRLKQVGTLIRWKSDPAQTVFSIIGVHGRLGSTARAGDNCQIWTSNGSYNGGWNGESSGAPLIGGSGDYLWNWDCCSTDNDNHRWSCRFKVDKMWASGPNHIFDGDEHVPQNAKDPLDPDAEEIMLLDGDKYGEAHAEGTVSSGTYPMFYEHNWYPITSDTKVKLDTANQLVEETVIQTCSSFSSGSNNHSPIHDSLAYTNKSVGLKGWNHNEKAYQTLEFLEPQILTETEGAEQYQTENPAIWETEPKEDVGLDIYYEASGAIPINPTHKENELLIPIGSTFTKGGVKYKVMAVDSWDLSLIHI